MKTIATIRKNLLFVILSLLINQCLAQLDTAKLGNNSTTGRYADIRGIKMYYEVYGKGEPLLFIHGNGGSINNFKFQAPYFSGKYKLIFADSRAQGKSIDKGDSISYEMMADDFNALLDILKIDSAFVIGWSDGGINALLLALRHPKKVKKLASTGANLWPDATAIDPWLVKEMTAMVNTFRIKNGEDRNRWKLTKMMVDQPNISLTQMKKITCPSLIIGGDHDVLLPTHTAAIAEAIPNSYLWVLPNSGHSTLIYYKDEFNKTVMDFFKKPFRKIEKADRFR
jgi:pimeloyl-ACP methyl ester carboxylesterase